MISYKPTLALDAIYSSTSDSASPIIKHHTSHLIEKNGIISTIGGTFDRSYMISVPSCVDILSPAIGRMQALSNASVKRQVTELLLVFQSKLGQINKDNSLANRLPALSLIEREDDSALVEWNFENYRIGFALEEDAKESNFFIVSQDRDLSQFFAETYLLNNNYDSVVSSLLSYVIRNS